MDTTVKCSKCFAHVDGFYTDEAGRRICKNCADEPELKATHGLKNERDSAPYPIIMEDRKVRMTLDALWWFRFLMASRPEDKVAAQAQELTEKEENDD